MSDYKKCPHCGGEILLAAIKCKHCKAMLSQETPVNIQSQNERDLPGKVTTRTIHQQPTPSPQKKNGGLVLFILGIIVVGFFCLVSTCNDQQAVVNYNGDDLGDGRTPVFRSPEQVDALVKRCGIAGDPATWALTEAYKHTPDDPVAQQYYAQIILNRTKGNTKAQLLRAEQAGEIYFINPGTKVRILGSGSVHWGDKMFKIRITDGQHAGEDGWVFDGRLHE